MNKTVTVGYEEYQNLLNEHKKVHEVLHESSLVLKVVPGRYGEPTIYIVKDNQSAFRELHDAFKKENKEMKEYYEKLLLDKKEKKGFWRRFF